MEQEITLQTENEEQEVNVLEESYNVKADLSNYYTKDETNTLLGAKQNTLTFDDTPTLNSSNPVTSGGIKTAIDNISSGSIYLGKLSDYNSSEKALSLNGLKEGVYCVFIDNASNYLYLKATYKGATLTNYYQTEGNSYYYQNNLFILKIVKELDDSLSTNTKIAEVSFLAFNTDSMIIKSRMFSVKIYTDELGKSGNISTFNVCTTDGAQTISAKKTFNTLPESSVAPTTSNQFVNKKYIDDTIGDINSVLATLVDIVQ